MNIAARSLAFALLFAFSVAPAQALIFVRVAPPPLPYYDQPVVPADGYLWTPGYWAWDDSDGDYFWVPGTWVMAPEPGYLWTPGYWAWDDVGYGYGWRPGYWGPRVGYYGGINYGYGYYGSGYAGGRWYGNRFSYNRAVNNVNVVYIHNTYNTMVIHRSDNRVSYNGGAGGLHASPRPDEQRAETDRHLAWTDSQNRHQDQARQDRGQFASVNQGRPQVGATPRPSDFRDATSGREPHGDDQRQFATNNALGARRDHSPHSPLNEPFAPRGAAPSFHDGQSPRQPWNSDHRNPGIESSSRPAPQPSESSPPPHRSAHADLSARPQMPAREGANARFAGSENGNRGLPHATPAMREARPMPHSEQGGRRERDQR